MTLALPAKLKRIHVVPLNSRSTVFTSVARFDRKEARKGPVRRDVMSHLRENDVESCFKNTRFQVDVNRKFSTTPR